MNCQEQHQAKQWPDPNTLGKLGSIGDIMLKNYLDGYLTLHARTFVSGLSYGDFIAPTYKYLMPLLGQRRIKDLSPFVLKEAYRQLYKRLVAPWPVIAGINRLLEVAFDYARSQGIQESNPAGALFAEFVCKNRRVLPYTQYPLIITVQSPVMVEDPGETKPFLKSALSYDIIAPYFSDIYYIGECRDDGISLVRRALIDELEVNPWPCADTSLSDWPLESNQSVVMVDLNT